MKKKTQIPSPLKAGDTIGIVAPAGALYNSVNFTKGVTILSEMGFSVKFPREGWPAATNRYLAGSDKQRAEEFNKIWADPEVAGIIALRGGFGCIRMVQYLDFHLLEKQPKLFMGFSDITILLNTISMRTGLVTFHGPVVTSLAGTTKSALQWFRYCLTTDIRRYSLIHPSSLEVLQDGPTVSAPLIGGNLATLVSLIGTQWDPDYTDTILLLEDINEPLYKIDRMLSQLELSGKLDSLAGVLLGNFQTAAKTPDQDILTHMRYQESVWQLVIEHCQKSARHYPIWANIPCGHNASNISMPIGATTTMDTVKKTLSFQI